MHAHYNEENQQVQKDPNQNQRPKAWVIGLTREIRAVLV